MKEKIVWESKHGHIIIIERKSFYNNNEIIYCIYKEKRDYERFNSYRYYDVIWDFVRWEYTLAEAVDYIKNNVKDSILE